MSLPRRALAAVSYTHLEDLLDLPTGVAITGLLVDPDTETVVFELTTTTGHLPVPPLCEIDPRHPPTVDLHYRAVPTLSGERLPRLSHIARSQVAL